MKPLFWIRAIVVACAMLATRASAQDAAGASDARLASLADSLLRLPAPASGIITFNVTGTPSAPGALYEMMIRIDSAKWIPPHTHNVEKRIRVLRGALLVGHGEAIDATKVERHAAGATLRMPANHAHFEGAGAATIIVLDARGPFTTTFVSRSLLLRSGERRPGNSAATINAAERSRH
jgi:hypothetical protein